MTQTPPALPLTPESRSLVAFCIRFRTKAGFMAQYERRLGEIWHTSRQKRGLKTKAYQDTEQLYEDLFCEGPRFADRESFMVAYSQHKRNIEKP